MKLQRNVDIAEAMQVYNIYKVTRNDGVKFYADYNKAVDEAGNAYAIEHVCGYKDVMYDTWHILSTEKVQVDATLSDIIKARRLVDRQ